SGGYRTEIGLCLLLRGRAYRQKGDYKSALESFQQQLQIAEKNGDQAQIASLHNSIGSLLFDQEAYADARSHFEQSDARHRSMGNQLNEGYALMNLGATLWWLGSYDDARKALDQASAIAGSKASDFKALQAGIDSVEAQIALNERRLPEAKAKSQQA